MADPTFAALGTLQYTGASDVSSMSSVITNVSVGDLLFAVTQREYQAQCTGVASSSPSLTFTKLKTATFGLSYFLVELWGAVATQAAASMTVTASYSSPNNWGAMFTARYSPGSITSIALHNSQAHTALQSATTNRTVTDIVNTVRTFMIATGADWDYYRTHTAAANWTKRVDSQTFGSDSTTQFFHDRSADAGTYPSGNFATASATDQYAALIVAIEIPSGGASLSIPVAMAYYRQRRN